MEHIKIDGALFQNLSNSFCQFFGIPCDNRFFPTVEPTITRDPKELAEAVREVLEQGSINLYMFNGGTNFGFMNGCSARGTLDLPQVTSYDYDALLDEEGHPTAKY